MAQGAKLDGQWKFMRSYCENGPELDEKHYGKAVKFNTIMDFNSNKGTNSGTATLNTEFDPDLLGHFPPPFATLQATCPTKIFNTYEYSDNKLTIIGNNRDFEMSDCFAVVISLKIQNAIIDALAETTAPGAKDYEIQFTSESEMHQFYPLFSQSVCGQDSRLVDVWLRIQAN